MKKQKAFFEIETFFLILKYMYIYLWINKDKCGHSSLLCK
jgi:hypothetical protein